MALAHIGCRGWPQSGAPSLERTSLGRCREGGFLWLLRSLVKNQGSGQPHSTKGRSPLSFKNMAVGAETQTWSLTSSRLSGRHE